MPSLLLFFSLEEYFFPNLLLCNIQRKNSQKAILDEMGGALFIFECHPFPKDLPLEKGCMEPSK